MFAEEITEEKIEVEDDPTPALCDSTKDYDIFKKLHGNRPVSNRHVRNLIESIKRENLLKYHPITVNENFEVVDGQHRLEAAKKLGIHIHFIVKVGSTYKTAGVLNFATEEWSFYNYLENFSKNGYPDYIKVSDFIDKHDVTLNRFKYLLSEKQKYIYLKSFKYGDFKLIDNLSDISNKIESINKIISFLDGILVIENSKFLYTDSFWRALYILLVKNDIEIPRLLEKLEIKRLAIRPLPTYTDYLKLILDIYNWKTKKQRVKIKELHKKQ